MTLDQSTACQSYTRICTDYLLGLVDADALQLAYAAFIKRRGEFGTPALSMHIYAMECMTMAMFLNMKHQKSVDKNS
jgi:hypothetical protein